MLIEEWNSFYVIKTTKVYLPLFRQDRSSISGGKMDKDKFQETLILQYRDEIEEILVESEHVYRSTIDYDLLDQKVTELMNAAKVDGLDSTVLWEMIEKRIPSYVNFVNHKYYGKKAA